MFFTRIGMIIAYVGFAVGALRLAAGLLIAFGTENIETNIAVARRYLNAENSGEAIDGGMYCIVISVALGILCEIRKSFR